MIPTRESPVTESNEQLQSREAEPREGNAAWLARCPIKSGIVLLGGTSLVDFRLRFAQSELRSDLSPSYWSMCGLINENGSMRTAPLQPSDISRVPPTNAVREVSMDEFDDPLLWPNVAVLSFADNPAAVQMQAERVAQRRTIVDLPPLVLDWLAYAWATNDGTNPLADGRGIPSAAFVHAAHSLAGIELTPGLASTAACPEAIWQAVKWWHDYYAGIAEIGAGAEAKPIVPRGYYALRQRAAAMTLPPDAPLFAPQPEPRREPKSEPKPKRRQPARKRS